MNTDLSVATFKVRSLYNPGALQVTELSFFSMSYLGNLYIYIYIYTVEINKSTQLNQ